MGWQRESPCTEGESLHEGGSPEQEGNPCTEGAVEFLTLEAVDVTRT